MSEAATKGIYSGVKKLYPYQQDAVERIFATLSDLNDKSNILFQLPTGGGKTVIFSEIARRFIAETGQKVLILTHRIELSAQIGDALTNMEIPNLIISSEVRDLGDQDRYHCFTAMVETLNNRLMDNENFISDVGLVIVDEAHYNAFRKIFQYFSDTRILGVTATPLSSNKNLPLNENYKHLIIGESIASLIEKGYLARPKTVTYQVNLSSLRIGVSGDYTVSSSERLYIEDHMQGNLLKAYEEHALGTKTLIFNSGIMTSRAVGDLFRRAGYPVRHLDSTFSSSERKAVLDWFRNTDNGILTSVGILTTGFDEPTVRSIILNRATRSLTLFHQMIGRGSRVLPNKKEFQIIDLGNNAMRLGFWDDFIDWKEVFDHPVEFLERLQQDEYEAQQEFEYSLPPEVELRFAKSADRPEFDVAETYQRYINSGIRPKKTVDASIQDQWDRIRENAHNYDEAMELYTLLFEEVEYRVKKYAKCIKGTDNYAKWLKENYHKKLRNMLRQHYLYED